MRCIFCKADSTNSISVEHVIPESLGNTTQVLPLGIVCDGCNNYFAREVEKPFLTSPSLTLLRFHQELVSKKGRVPSITGVISPGIPVVLRRHPKQEVKMSIDVPPDSFNLISKSKEGTLIFPLALSPPGDNVVSRFLAKAAIEAMAQRLIGHTDGLEYVVDEVQLDPIRNHARRGTTVPWPTYSRRIYDAEAKWINEGGENVQVVHEFDFLVTKSNEWYFVLAVFGQEYSINIGGPEIDGYLQWLKENDNASPLYHGKNAHKQGIPYRTAD